MSRPSHDSRGFPLLSCRTSVLCCPCWLGMGGGLSAGSGCPRTRGGRAAPVLGAWGRWGKMVIVQLFHTTSPPSRSGRQPQSEIPVSCLWCAFKQIFPARWPVFKLILPFAGRSKVKAGSRCGSRSGAGRGGRSPHPRGAGWGCPPLRFSVNRAGEHREGLLPAPAPLRAYLGVGRRGRPPRGARDRARGSPRGRRKGRGWPGEPRRLRRTKPPFHRGLLPPPSP